MTMTTHLTFLLTCLLCCLQPTATRVPPQLTSKDSRQLTQAVGSSVRLQCAVTSDPPPMIEWFKWNPVTHSDELINSGWDRYRTQNHALKIKDAHVDDSGKFLCRATNGFGSIAVDYWLHVTSNDSDTMPPWEQDDRHYGSDGEAPQLVKKEQMVGVIVKQLGGVVRFRCKATGHPKPDILWFKDGVALFESSSGLLREHKWSKVVKDLEKSDSGRYTCRVFNHYGAINHTYTLHVVGHMEDPVIIGEHPQNLTLSYGESATLPCRVVSDAQPTIKWLKLVESPVDRSKNNTVNLQGQDYSVLQTSQLDSVRVKSVSPEQDGTHYLNKLILQQVTTKDSGLYVCLGINIHGHSHRGAYLHVLPPDPSQIMPEYEYTDSYQSPSVFIYIVIAAVVVVAAITATVCIVQHRKNRNRRPVTVVARKAQAPPTNKASTSYPKQVFAEYAALQPNYHGQPPPGANIRFQNVQNPSGMQCMPTQEPIYNPKPYDLYSDVSMAKVASPVMQPLTQNQLYNHNLHTNDRYIGTDY